MAPGIGSALLVTSLVAVAASFAYQSQLLAHSAAQEAGAVQLVTCNAEREEEAVSSLRKILSYDTVSDVTKPNHVRQPDQFRQLWASVQAAYPDAWKALEVEEAGVEGLSRLLTWQGSDSSKLPALFISHVDVVPVQPETLSNWTHGPFSGELADGYVWGRGALDVKVSVISMLEAVTRLLHQGYKPSRTLLFAFGQDEELGGALGAGHMAEVLQERYPQGLEVVVDEGSTVIMDGLPPFAPHPVALVGVAEKGFVNVKVTLQGAGGHSSMPPPGGATVIEAAGRLITIVTGSPMPLVLQSPMTEFLQALAPHAPAPFRPLLHHCNLPGLSWVWARVLAASRKQVRALVATTVVPTMVSAGIATNVIPQQLHLLINVRTLPGTTTDDILEFVRAATRRALALTPGLNATVVAGEEGNEASQVTPVAGPYYRLLKRAIQETQQFDGEPVKVAPFLLTGGTDSKHYRALSRHGILRFMPFAFNVTAGDVDRVHGIDERVAVPNFLAAICSYTRILTLFANS